MNFEFNTNLFVFHGNYLICCILLLFLKLLNTFLIESQESGDELNSVLEVRLDLIHCTISNQSLLIRVTNHSSICIIKIMI